MATDLSSAHIYTDFIGLSDLKLAARNKSPEALREVANQFEAMFLKMMLKQMRDASLGEGILESEQTRLYQDMMDQQIALDLAGQHSIGIADMLTRQLDPSSEPQQSSHDVKFIPVPQTAKRINNDHVPIDSSAFHEQTGFKSPREFVEVLRPYAESAARQLGVTADVLLAQSALETGWGQKIIRHHDGRSSHNLFAIKADNRWGGKQIRVGTLEYVDGQAKREHSSFRVYQSFQQSFDDYVDFLQNNPRYREAIHKAEDGYAYIRALQKQGYATDPAYAEKVIDIMQRDLI
ncbi:MAG: flagellar assembly peptidoglycan hydrolase FlgJ [Gammaproteobacteria bacterium]